jgi:hypothetical protein
MRAFAALSVLAMLLPVSAAVAAEDDAPKPAEAAEVARLKVTVESVTGKAQRRNPAEDGKWTALKAGDALDELTVIRTGFGSKVVLVFADRGRVTVDSVTKIGISEFRKKEKKVNTRLGLKYGTLRAKVNSKVGPVDFRVQSPTATLSVRGSEKIVGYCPNGGSKGKSLVGDLILTSKTNRRQVVRPGEVVGGKKPLVPMDRMMPQYVPFLGDAFGGSTRVERVSYVKQSSGRAAGGGFVPDDKAAKKLPVVPVTRTGDGPGHP